MAGNCNQQKPRLLTYLMVDAGCQLRTQLGLSSRTPTWTSTYNCLGFLTAWWLGSRRQWPKTTRKKLCHFLSPSFRSHKPVDPSLSRVSVRQHNSISWEECQSHTSQEKYIGWETLLRTSLEIKFAQSLCCMEELNYVEI